MSNVWSAGALALFLSWAGALDAAAQEEPRDGATRPVELRAHRAYSVAALLAPWAEAFGAVSVVSPQVASVEVFVAADFEGALSFGSLRSLLAAHGVAVGVERAGEAGAWLIKAAPQAEAVVPDVAALRETVRRLEARIQALEARLGAAGRQRPGWRPRGAEEPPRSEPTTRPASTADAPAPAAIPAYFAKGALPPAEQVPGIPWLRRVSGLRYKRPLALDGEALARVRDRAGLAAACREAETTAVETGYGVRLQFGALPAESVWEVLGLRPGDQLVAVNGVAIEPTQRWDEPLLEAFAASRVALLVIRRGAPTVISFTLP